MKIENIVRKSVLSQPVYQAGKPIEYVAREFGLDPDGILKMASNENPMGPCTKAIEAVSKSLDNLNYYPDGGCYELGRKISKKMGLKPTQLVFGNGSNEVIELVAHALLNETDNAVMGAQSFIVYKLSTLLMGAEAREVPMPGLRYDLQQMLDAVDEKTKIVFLANPNNPTGTVLSQKEVFDFVRALPEHVVFCYDEAYSDFQDEPVDIRGLIAEGRNVIGLKTFSKIYGLAGLRAGYGYCSEELAGYINRVREPFNMNTLAQIAAMAALDDDEFYEKSKAMNKQGRAQIEKRFNELGLEYISEGGNFIMVKVKDALKKFDALQRVGVIVRPNVGYGLPDWLRITIGTPGQNERFLAEFAKLL
ncbi:MAG: histidinol-phosphate transaminase [Opitutales bacterium]|nr:histidinol-phosphate transaminase [Opitutales bacterium]